MIIKNNKIMDSCSDTLPIGTLQPFIGVTAPQGYLFCEGQLLDKSKYPELYSICGDLFGESTTTQFYLPDLRGRVIAGYDENDTSFNTIGKLLGEKSHTLTVSEMPSHTHGIYGALTGENKSITNSGNDWGVGTTRGWNTAALTDTGGGQAHNNIQPTLVLKWIVKAYALLPTDYFANGYDNMPVGSCIEYNGDNIPTGYEEIDNDLKERVEELENKIAVETGEEQQIGMLDDLPLYRKIYSIGSSSSLNTDLSLSLGISNLKKVISLTGGVYFDDFFIPWNFYNWQSTQYSFIGFVKGNSIYYRINHNISSGIFILEYTKEVS